MGNVQNIMGVLYSCTTFLGMFNMMSVMPILGYERSVMYRSVFTAELHTGRWVFREWPRPHFGAPPLEKLVTWKPCTVVNFVSMAIPGTHASQTHTKTCLL